MAHLSLAYDTYLALFQVKVRLETLTILDFDRLETVRQQMHHPSYWQKLFKTTRDKTSSVVRFSHQQLHQCSLMSPVMC